MVASEDSSAPRFQRTELEARRSNGNEFEACRSQQGREFIACALATAEPGEHVQIGPRERSVVLAGTQPLRANTLHEQQPGATCRGLRAT